MLCSIGMKPMEHRKGRALVFAQFLLIALIVLFGMFPSGSLRICIFLLGSLIGVWAIATMRLRVSIFPEPGLVNKLTFAGPYKFIRHPMYTAVIISTASFVASVVICALWVLLLVVLLYKLSYEESLLLAKFPDYKAYMLKTKRLVPLVY